MRDWAPADEHAVVRQISSAADWSAIADDYGQAPETPFARVLAVAKAHRVRTVIEEIRYVDTDYRSEYSAFWSKRFADRSAFTRRLHFFKKSIDVEWLLTRGEDPGYVGYTTLRPTTPGRVGRTMLSPPRRLSNAVLTTSTDRLSLFGRSLEVTGVPFMEQDGEFLRCAHVAVWVCHYHANRHGLVGRRSTAELAALSPLGLSQHRSLPSPGLTLNQLQAIFVATGQPALFYGISKLPDVEGVDIPAPATFPNGVLKPHGLWDTRIFSVLCRYLNAGFPVLVGTHNHAFVVCGWFLDGSRIRFVAADDQWGPYEVVGSPFADHRGDWKAIMIPLPPKVFLSGEVAESRAHLRFRGWGSLNGAPQEWLDLRDGVESGELSLRTFLRSNHDYKSVLSRQGRGRVTSNSLRVARLPHFVWVVEAQDRKRRRAGKPCVVAELVVDSTSGDNAPNILAESVPGVSLVWPPGGVDAVASVGSEKPWTSHLSNH